MVKTSRSRSPSPTGLVKDDPNVGSTPRHPLHRSHSSLTPSSFSFISRPTQQSLSQKLKTALPFSRFYSNTLTVTTASDPLLPSLLTEHGSLFHLPQPIVLSSSTTRPRYPSGKLSLTHPRFHADLPESTTAPISKYTATISRRRRSVDALNIVHDVYRCMFKVTLDTKGSLGTFFRPKKKKNLLYPLYPLCS
ncbi:uncharacterized protein BYT42DRAFT_399687 [Radiomyces spectabilis]|uniref:uncharacterized protein n=1 Tax=Radiomyces spectabilis TaxID=64574 RepID=UPI00221E496E|nr:uncharacterized protein BYT42DRAFT_399687 [Radiomyces spectabilis]KAI8374310.1 hypothetical protein BYT42DRAFT_399687 [Radiomyces spectabilis]